MSTVGALLGKLGSLTGLPISDDVDMGQVGDTGDAESLEAMAELSNGLLGHLLGNAHDNGSGHVRWSLVSDWRRLLFWITAVVAVLLVAAATNPTESSFRSHLTELSFRKHLADIRSSDETSSLEIDATGDAGSTSLATTVTTASGSDTPNIAPFRFANHVAISLRTPLLYFKTLFFLSFALTSPLSPPPCFQEHSAGPGGKKHSPPVPKERIVLFLGYFGHWVWVGYVPRRAEWAWRFVTEGTREKGRKKSAIMDRPGILELRAVLPKEDSLVKPTVTLTPSPSVKHMRRVDSSTSLVDHGSLPLHPHPTAIPVAPFVVESRRGSIVNLVPTQTIPPPAAITDLSDNASSPLLTALKADLTTAQNVVNELKAQLHSHEASVSDAHSHLQTSLEDLRTRRKEDDAERQELKTRTKHLEEQKRQAEGARREAEKKLKAVEGVRDGLQAKIAAAMEQVRNMKGMMANSKQAVTGINDDNVRLLVENYKAIEGKRTELEELESKVNELDTKNDELGKAVKEAEERVDAVKRAGDEARKMGPEEEMMMMAAAYEAAAQEGFQHASGPAQHHAPTQHSNFGGASNRNSGPGSDQWASQAAAYMAEAGMPFLDQSYTARPSQSASFGHLAKPHLVPGRVSTPERPSSLAGDLRGFEGFGPGPLSKAIGLERRSSDYQHRSSTPPASDSGSDVWGHDPGSPNGGISSSFTANLLPQGLFRSLEGDQTPSIAGLDVDDDDDDDDLFHPAIAHPQDASRNVTPNSVSLAKAVDNAMNENRSASGSEGSDDASAGRQVQLNHGEREHVVLESPDLAWRSPLPAPGAVHHQALVQSDHRLLPPSSTTPPGVPSIPGLPSLPDSRRWFSGTSGAASTENLGMSINLGAVLGSGSNHHSANSSNIFGISPSNDSLHILSGGPYDSNSPFAPSAVEKQQLALKWGPLSKYRWGKPQGEAGQQAHSGQRNESGITRSTSHDLSTNGSTSTWLSSRFPSGSIGKKDTSNLSNVFNRLDHHPQDHHQGHLEPMGLSPDHRQGDGGEGQQANLSTSAEKKAFRFFSLRRPNSSGKDSDRLSDKLGTSPSSKFGSSPSSKGE